jgi:O-antigen ligase
MKAVHPSASARDGLHTAVFLLAAAMLLFAPLIKGGNRPLPLLTLELAALPLLVWAVLRPQGWPQLSKPALAGIALLLIAPLLQRLPLPLSLWGSLPGREPYAAALQAFGAGAPTSHPLSLLPAATEAAWLALLPPLAVFLVALALREAALKKLVYVFLAIAAAQAILGLVQFGGGAQGGFRTSLADIGTAVGTYANRNHLASMLAMALPIGLGLLAARIGRRGDSLRYRSRKLVRRVAEAVSQPSRLNQSLLLGALCVVLLLGIVFTRSRSGIVLAMLAILASALLYGARIGSQRSTRVVALLSAVGVALALEIGLSPVLERFSVGDALEDARWTIFGSSLAGLGEFFPLGSGIGTFPDVYRRFQPDSIGLFVNHAHNDYLEYVFEGGLVAALVVVLFAVAWGMGWPRLLKQRHWGSFAFMQAGAGLGVLLMALHGFTDYNWHIPANALYFAFLAGVFLHRGEARPAPAAPAPAIVAVEMPPPAPLPGVTRPASNPFAD